MKYQISQSQKAIYGVMLLAVFLSSFSGGNFHSARAQSAPPEASLLSIQTPDLNEISGIKNIDDYEDETIKAQTTGTHTITYFQGNKAGAVSFTFDDGYVSHRTIAIPQLNTRGLKGTFFVITGREDSSEWSAWQSAVSQGHEVASHTVTHRDLTTLSEEEMRVELSESQAAITQNVPGQSCASLAYPYTSSNSTIRAAAIEYYDAARGGSSPANFLNHYQAGQDQYGSWTAIDFSGTRSKNGDSLVLDDQYLNDQYFNNGLDAAVLRHAWLTLHIHDITDETTFGNFLDYVQGKPDYWIDTYCNISRYMKERLNSTVQVITDDTSEIRLSLVMDASLSTDTYNFPLTLRSTVPSSWTVVEFQQGSTAEELVPVSEGNEKVVYYQAVPNGGDILLTNSEDYLPTSFNKANPVPGALDQPINTTLTWTASIGATSYEYCYDTSDDNDCMSWTSNGASTNKTLTDLAPVTTYYWHVRAANQNGTTYANGSSTAFRSFMTVPNPPAGFNKSSPANGATNQQTSLTLTWDASAGATSYQYCYDTTNDNACSSWTSNGNSTSKALSSLSTATTYYWHVRAVNSGGTTYADGSSTAYRSFTTVPNPPAAFNKSSPANGATNQSTSLTLTWAASTGATSYQYCYDTSNDNACSSWTSNGTSTSKALSGLTPGLTYYWHTRAVNSGGSTYSNNSNSAFWSFTLSCYTLTKSVNPGAGGTIDTNPAPNCNSGTQYTYGTVVTLTSIPSSSYSFFTWSGDVSDSSAVVNLTMTSNKSVTATFATLTNNLSAPLLRSPQSNLLTLNNRPTFLWNNVLGGQTYEIVFATDSGFANIVESKKLSELAYTPVSPMSDGKYYWHVRAYNAGNQFGNWSTSRSFTVDTIGPSTPVPSLPTDTASSIRTPTFKWFNVPTAVSYEFQYDNDSNFSSPAYTVTTQSNYRKPPAMKTGIYYWRVRAKDAAGNWSIWSAPFTITITGP